MTQEKLKELLNKLRSLPSETEWMEFKKAATSFHFNDIGKILMIYYGVNCRMY
jgi:ATP-dependent DNA helicase RecG